MRRVSIYDNLKAPLLGRRPDHRWVWVFISLAIGSVLLYVCAPWPSQEKSIALLRGLCTQQPDHSYWFGAVRLPFDARMTGIYGAALIGQLYLLTRGRLRAARPPSRPIIAALAVFVILMGIDGANSTLNDLGLPALYTPQNWLRFATGALTGTTAAIAIWLLAGYVLWDHDARSDRPVIGGWREIGHLLALSAAFGLLVAGGWEPLYRPLALTLVIAAVTTLFPLFLTLVQLVRDRQGRARNLADLAGPACVALPAVYLFMALVAGARFGLDTLVKLSATS